jgi:hypothetical protein
MVHSLWAMLHCPLHMHVWQILLHISSNSDTGLWGCTLTDWSCTMLEEECILKRCERWEAQAQSMHKSKVAGFPWRALKGQLWVEQRARVPPGLHSIGMVRCNNLPTVLCTYPWMPVDVYAKACNLRVNCQAVATPYVLTNCTICVSLKCSKCGRNVFMDLSLSWVLVISNIIFFLVCTIWFEMKLL